MDQVNAVHVILNRPVKVNNVAGVKNYQIIIKQDFYNEYIHILSQAETNR